MLVGQETRRDIISLHRDNHLLLWADVIHDRRPDEEHGDTFSPILRIDVLETVFHYVRGTVLTTAK